MLGSTAGTQESTTADNHDINLFRNVEYEKLPFDSRTPGYGKLTDCDDVKFLTLG